MLDKATMREKARQRWLEQMLPAGFALHPLAGDASFRRYFRIREPSGASWILMDAPPAHEDAERFLAVCGWLKQAGLRAPALKAANIKDGFLLLEDFGDQTLAGALADDADPTPLLADALRQVHLLQRSSPGIRLKRFDLAHMRRECDLYLDWYLPHVAGVKTDPGLREAFHAELSPLLEMLADLPLAPVHLDYHSRNLMLPPDGLPLAVIDFQDAMWGPVTYDPASLLYDCYQDYPEAQRRQWSEAFYAELPQEIRISFGDAQRWHRALRLTALQRHIKAIGIFARLAYRDGKRRFLDEIPLTRKHLLEEMKALGMRSERYPLLFIPPSEQDCNT